MYKIYCITNLKNQKQYIGQTKRSLNTRFFEHMRNDEPLRYAREKYGINNFIIELIEDKISEDEINNKERYYIKQYKTLSPNGYNLSDGGQDHNTISEEGKRRLSERHMGINNPKCGKKILQYDLDGNFLNSFGSAREAGRYLGNENKYRSIANCLYNKKQQTLGFIWKYEESI